MRSTESTNGDILDDLRWPLTTQNHPIFYILQAFHISVTGEGSDFKFGGQVDKHVPPCRMPMTNCSWKGHGQGNVESVLHPIKYLQNG